MTGTRPQTIAALGIVLVYCLLQVVLFAMHDPWLDEAQAWIWARQLSLPIDFLVLPGEGHPPLWYWLLRLLSLAFEFNQARAFSLLVAMGNAFLLWRLLGRDAMTLFALLGSFVMLQFWGYHFRPYGLVFSCILIALLLDRDGRRVAATWVMALACGLHFFAGMLFAFWLVYQRTKGTALLALLGPAALALVFGALAVLSGLDNGGTGPITADLLVGTLHNLSWVGMIPPLRGPWLAAATVAVLAVALWRHKLILVTVLVLLVAFATGTAAVYGKYPWHLAFMTMLCFMAIVTTGIEGRRWALILLLLPQVAIGVAGVTHRLSMPAWTMPDLYQAVATDAGAGFDPATQLVAWPDFAGVAIVAAENITMLSGNDGSVLGPIDWRHRAVGAIDPALATRATPFWLICGEECEKVLHFLAEHGRTTTLLAKKTNVDNGDFFAYRVE